jgi:hypothetical protein
MAALCSKWEYQGREGEHTHNREHIFFDKVSYGTVQESMKTKHEKKNEVSSGN